MTAREPNGERGAGQPATEVGIPARCHDILTGRGGVGFLATHRADGSVSVTPVSPMFDGTHIRISTTTARVKYRNMLADPRVTFCMCAPDNPLRYVQVRGRVTILSDGDRSFVDSLARHHLGADRYPYDGPGVQRVVITLHPEHVSAPTTVSAGDG